MKISLRLWKAGTDAAPSGPADKLARKDWICKQEKPGARSVLKFWMEEDLNGVA